MAGHSQFKNIMYRKGSQDAKRSKAFAKLAREISVAVKNGSDDPKQNPRLRNAIINARSENMPNERIAKAIQKAIGSDDDKNYEEIIYEGYGVAGVAIIIDALTDNRNRTASEIRSTLAKNGGTMAETGSVSFNFTKIGRIIYPCNSIEDNHIFETAVESGASDIIQEKENHIVTCSLENFGKLRDSLVVEFGDPISAKIEWKALNTITINEAQAEKLLKTLSLLEDYDDIQSVYSNFEIPIEVLEKISFGS